MLLSNNCPPFLTTYWTSPGAKLLEVAAIRISYGLLLQAVEIATNFRNKLRELIGDFDGRVNEPVEF